MPTVSESLVAGNKGYLPCVLINTSTKVNYGVKCLKTRTPYYSELKTTVYQTAVGAIKIYTLSNMKHKAIHIC
jgi:hypothetical protein